VRVAHPAWGPARIVWQVERESIEPLPGRSAVYRALPRHVLVAGVKLGGEPACDRFWCDRREVRVTTDQSQWSPYALSFTSGALLLREAAVASPIYLREHDWSKVRALIEGDNLLQARTVASGHRLARKTAQRLAVLTEDELELLVDGTTTERGHLLWAAACRRYDLIAEFAEEVLRERFLLFTSTLGYDEFDSFIRTKALTVSGFAAV
jgi:Putative inner membrane protein (DUF1819)